MTNGKKDATSGQTITALLIGGILIWGLVKCMGPGDLAPDTSSTPTVSTETAQFLMEERAKDAVRSRLKDPESATFDDVRYHNSAKVGHIVCGKVNAKNSFGGYNGNTRFVSNGMPDVTFLESEVSDFETVWSELCIN